MKCNKCGGIDVGPWNCGICGNTDLASVELGEKAGHWARWVFTCPDYVHPQPRTAVHFVAWAMVVAVVTTMIVIGLAYLVEGGPK